MSRYILRVAIDEDARAHCRIQVCDIVYTVQWNRWNRFTIIKLTVIKSPGINNDVPISRYPIQIVPDWYITIAEQYVCLGKNRNCTENYINIETHAIVSLVSFEIKK